MPPGADELPRLEVRRPKACFGETDRDVDRHNGRLGLGAQHVHERGQEHRSFEAAVAQGDARPGIPARSHGTGSMIASRCSATASRAAYRPARAPGASEHPITAQAAAARYSCPSAAPGCRRHYRSHDLASPAP